MESETNKEWEPPVIEDLGEAKDLIQGISEVTGGDTQFSPLTPS